MKVIFSMLVAGLLVGCAAPIPRLNLNDQQAVSNQVAVKRDDFKKHTEYKGPNAAPDNISDSLFIRAWKKDGSGDAEFQIYVMDHYYGEWRFYNAAWDSNGDKLDTIVIARDVDTCSKYGCSHNEHIGINVSRAYLEKSQGGGVNFKISGKAGDEIFFIPPGYIKGFLAAVK